jgi:WD40 repeat protein
METNADVKAAVHSIRLPTEPGEVNLCVFVDDGRRAFTAIERDPVRLWDIESARCRRVFGAESVHAWAVKPSADEASVIIGGRDGTVRIVDRETGRILYALEGHGALIRCADASPDMTRVISGSAMRDHLVRVWDVQSARCIHAWEGHRDGIYSVAFDAEQRRALSGSRDTTVRVWDLTSGRCLAVLEGHTYHVHAVAWAADGRRPHESARDIRLWAVETGRCLRVFEGHTETIRSVIWSADNRHALSAAHDRTVRIWDVERGECVQVFEGHGAGAINAVWTDGGREVVSCDWTGEIRRWQVAPSLAVDIPAPKHPNRDKEPRSGEEAETHEPDGERFGDPSIDAGS